MYELQTGFEKVQALLAPLDQHLAIRAILAGGVPGKVYVDDPVDPQAALAWTKYRLHLAGSAHNEAFNQALGPLFAETIIPQIQAGGDDSLVLYYAPDDWEEAIGGMFGGQIPWQDWRHYYILKELCTDWRALLPPGMALRPVDRALLAETGLKNLDDLQREMRSERPSVEEFLDRSFGFSVVCGDELIAWCLSEYNCGDRCEVGIETLAGYRRRGLATVTATALAEHAFAHGIAQVGWHCWAYNEPSVRTALKVGWAKVCDYPVYALGFDEAINLAMHGTGDLRQGKDQEALEWLQKAFQCEDAPMWAYANAALAYTRLGQDDAALAYLNQAVDHGLDDLDYLNRPDRWQSLRGTEGWRRLLARVEGRRS